MEEQKMTLYEISDLYQSALESICVDEGTGEIINADEIERLDAAFDDKADAVACYIKNLVALCTGMKAEEANLAARRRAIEKKTEYLRGMLAASLEGAGKTKLETPRCRLSFRRSSAVVVYDETALPEEFVTVKTTETPNKTAIKDAINAGTIVPGAAIEERQTLQIK